MNDIHSSIADILVKRGCDVKMRDEEPAREGKYAKPPIFLNKKIKIEIENRFPEGIYSHQAIAIHESIFKKNHVALTTSTASGKSLSFMLPAFQALLTDHKATALYVFPLKALANDQMRKLESWASKLGLQDAVQRVDGSVKGEARKEALQRARLLVTTPDVLHTTLLREGRLDPLKSFFTNLQYIILDECHEYDGVFGSHASYVFRRLRQLCRSYGAEPRFIMASATVGNPEKFLQVLTGLNQITMIDEKVNGSPKADKSIWLADPGEAGDNPRLIAGLIADLVKINRKFIVFCNSRLAVERTGEQLREYYPSASRQVRTYKAGILSEKRQQIEDELHNGEIRGVISTSALEMGIDLPDLDVCLMIGLPDSRVSLLQRMGRVGRSQSGAVILLAARTAHDLFYTRHPNIYFGKKLEEPVINLEHREIILAHFACARVESADFSAPMIDADIFGEAFCQIAGQKNLFECAVEILHELQPQFKVQIRAVDDPSYKFVVGFDKTVPEIGTITYSQLLREAVPEGVCIHQGKHYRVKKVSHGDKVVFLNADCDPFTRTVPRTERMVKERLIRRDLIKRSWNGLELRQASLGVLEKVTGFTERNGAERKLIEYKQPLMRYFATTGLVFEINDLEDILPAGLYGAATAILRAWPLVTGNAKGDIAVYAYRTPEGKARIFLYDNVSGGLRLAEQTIMKMSNIIEVAIEQVESCTYCDNPENGCILCVIDEHWTGYEPIQARASALILLSKLLKTIREPEKQAAVKLAPAARDLAPSGVFGRMMIVEGSSVFTRDKKEGIVLHSEICSDSQGQEPERMYTLQCAGKERSYFGYSLKLIMGNLEQWCINCGQEGIDLEMIECPNCRALLSAKETPEGAGGK